MDEVRIAGVGMTRFGRELRRGERAMAAAVTGRALADAGVPASAVQRVFAANAAAGLVSGQEMIRGQVALRGTPLAGVPLVNVENACASGSSAVLLAYEAILAGRCEVAVAVGVEKMSHEDKARTFDALRGATDVAADARGTDTGPAKNSVFVEVYAREARRYLDTYGGTFGATVEDFAAVAVKNRFHASLNPLAQYRKPQTVAEVLAGRTVVDPLTLPMCSPTTDGAAAVVLCSAAYARRHSTGRCGIRAARLAAGGGQEARPVAAAAGAAFEDAGLGPGDLDLVEVHDAAAPAEVAQYAEIGLCPPGEGHLLVREGVTALGGRTPVNTDGGLMSRGHPIGATGCAQLVELYDQLLGRAGERQVARARVGLAVNAGGWLAGSYAAAVATILVKAG
ncbi:thiolase family protein [Streptomyces sp. NPDC093085]|uniref:thiolase family protein n=1 Tax=Streptomyces sp. NPDC093085 TaxID=3155068 RepID=UPI00341EF23F